VTFPVAAGDKCLLVFVERDLSGWRQRGEELVPPTSRMHEYSDAVAMMGLSPSNDALSPAVDAASMQIRSDDGATVIEVGAADITITAAGDVATIPIGAFSVTSTGSITLSRGGIELLAVISAALDLIGTSTAGGDALSNAAPIAALKVLIDGIRNP